MSILRAQLAEQMDDVPRHVNDTFASLPPEQFPFITRLRPLMMTGSGDDRFRWWIEVILSGLAAAPPPVAGNSGQGTTNG